MRELVAPTEERLRMFLPPCYSPQPNLEERVWEHFEDDRVTRRVFWAKDEPKIIILGPFHRSHGLPRSVGRLLGGPPTCIHRSGWRCVEEPADGPLIPSIVPAFSVASLPESH